MQAMNILKQARGKFGQAWVHPGLILIARARLWLEKIGLVPHLFVYHQPKPFLQPKLEMERTLT